MTTQVPAHQCAHARCAKQRAQWKAEREAWLIEQAQLETQAAALLQAQEEARVAGLIERGYFAKAGA